MPRSASLAALPRSAATRAVSPSLVITDITGSGGSGGLRMPLPPRLGPLSPVAPFDFFPAGAPKGGFVGFGGHADSVIGGRPPTSPDGLRRHEDGSLARNGLMPILPPSTAVGPRVVRAAASADAIDAIGPVHGFGGPGMPYLEHHSLLMKRNRSLEMAVKRMGAELSQWREEGSLREEAHRLKLAQLDARHEHEREKYEARLRAAAEESLRALEKQRAELIGQGGASEYARRQREKQIEHLTQMAARRMGRQELGRGWRAWLDLFLESRRRERVLRGAASRLLRPKLLHGYGDWKAQWWKAEEARRVAAVVAEGQREGSARVAAAQAEMAKQALLRAAEEKRERVTHLTKVAARRLGQLSMARGFGAWSGAHKEGLRRRRLLRQAGIRLTRPKVVAAYTEWREGWRAAEAERAAVLARMSLAEQVHELAVRLSAAETELRRTQAELSLTRQAAADGIAREVEISRRAHEEAARLKERRVEHLTQLAARRMGKRELAMGFESWASSYFERSRRKRVLRLAGAKLTRPKLVACYGHWRRDWTGERAELARLSFKGRLQLESAMLAETRAELARTRTEAETLATRLSALDGGSAAREAALTKQLEAEREKRVEGLKAVAIRRMVLKELARGWSGWFAMYEAQVQQRNLLKKAGARLTKPTMSAYYHQWRRSWEETEAASLRRGALAAELRAVELGTSHGTLAEECERLRAELAAAREAMLRGEGYEVERERRQEEREARTRERRIEHLSALAARRMGKKELAMGWQAWSELYHEKVHQKSVLRQAALRLQRPKFVWSYVRWRESWRLALVEESKLTIREQLGTERKRRADAEAAITELHSEYGVKMRELGVTVGEAREAALEYLRQLKLATRDGAEWADKCELLQAKWAEMTDEDRIGREARRLLEAQQKTEHEATEARLGRLLAEQRSQLLREAVAMRGDLEKQLHELQMALAHATALPPTKQKAPANEVSLEKVPSKESTSKDDLTSKMRASYDDFAALDADGTNDLGFEEFSRLWASKCTREGAPTPSEMEVRAIFNQLDQDHSGSVDLSEYIQWALREALDASRGRVLDLFREWDTDGSGTVDKKEFGAALKGMGFPCGKGDLDKIFGDLDQGGSGQIDYTELNESLRRAKVKKTESPRQSGSTKASPKLRAKPTRAKPSQA